MLFKNNNQGTGMDKKEKGSSTTALINVNPQTHNRSERPITSKENNSFLFTQEKSLISSFFY